jgi:hypothetical protein
MRRTARKTAAKKPTRAARGTAIARRNSSEPKAYEPTQKEHELCAAFRKRRDNAAPAVRFKVTSEDNVVEIRNAHPDLAMGGLFLMQAFGTTNGEFAEGLIKQLADVVGKGKAPNEADLNYIIAMLQGIGPRDETGAMLATQMTAIHCLTMTAARRLGNVENIQQQDSASNMFNKLARTFTSQVEALKKYRSTGEQNIRVQHVNVSEGGQAIVGNVQTGGGGEHENEEQSHEPGNSFAQRPALPCDVQANETTMPSPSRKGKDGVPLSRSACRSTKRPS